MLENDTFSFASGWLLDFNLGKQWELSRQLEIRI